MKKRYLIFILISFLFSMNLFCQEAESIQEFPVTETPEFSESRHLPEIFGKPFRKPESASGFFSSGSFTFSLPASAILNTLDRKHSAPSQHAFTPKIAFLWPDYTLVGVEPSLGLFSTYSLWYDGAALPAEIENRTATTLSLFLEVPASFSLFLKHSRVQLRIGPALLMRFSWLAHGVSESDWGNGPAGTAGEDAELIAKYYWSNARFLYLSTGFSWLFNFYGNTRAGPELSVALPLGGIIAGDGFNNTMLSIGLKVSF